MRRRRSASRTPPALLSTVELATVALAVLVAPALARVRLPTSRHPDPHRPPWPAAPLGLERVWPLTGVTGQNHQRGRRHRRPAPADARPACPAGGRRSTPGRGPPARATATGRACSSPASSPPRSYPASGLAPEATALPVLQASNGQDSTVDKLGSGIRAAVDRHTRVVNGLFTSRGPDRLGLAHQTYMEYLAARALAARPSNTVRPLLQDDRRWRPCGGERMADRAAPSVR
jgi:hypothetical protein